MAFIDLHCDTLMHTWQEEPGQDLVHNTHYSVDFNRLIKSQAIAQFFAIFMLDETYRQLTHRPPISDWDYILSSHQQFNHALSHEPRVSFACSYQDLQTNHSQGKVSAFLTLEDGRPLEDSLDRVFELYELGIRLITLTWNHENCLGYPNSSHPQQMKLGLKPFGIEVIEVMNDLGMIIDVSHLSDGGFYDVLAHSKKPFLASHSNARQICSHPRNLTDHMIRQLANKGGIMGINFYPYFLSDNPRQKKSWVEDIVHHLNYVRQLAGVEVLSLGSDFDGFVGAMELHSCDQMDLLFDRLDQEGWSTNEIEGLAYRNAMRFLKETLP